jgi:CheY-like chemotaxis protein
MSQAEAKNAPWNILIVDDDPLVHTISSITLQDLQFQGRGLCIASDYSAKDAAQRLAQPHDFALVWLDVMMESDEAGLDLVPLLRAQAHNLALQIIIRTGQSGATSEWRAVQDFDINGFVDKAACDALKLRCMTLCALRAFAQLSSLLTRPH